MEFEPEYTWLPEKSQSSARSGEFFCRTWEGPHEGGLPECGAGLVGDGEDDLFVLEAFLVEELDDGGGLVLADG